MSGNTGFWTWPVDVAASRSGSERLVIGSSALYAVGALLLLARLFVALPTGAAAIGVALVLTGLAGSLGVLGRVLVVRSRLSPR